MKQPIPLEEIGLLLKDAMALEIANGADSRSMPNEYVAIAHFVCYPEKYYIPIKEEDQ